MKEKRLLVLSSLCLFVLTGCNTAEEVVKKPNVLLILVDDLGWADVGAYNPETSYSTPSMDRLAAEGLLFTDGYAASPVCSPTRASLITGQHPTRLGTTDFFRNKARAHRYREGKFVPAQFDEQLPNNTTTIADVLGESGYATAFIGKWHLGQTEEFWPENHGFDVNIAGHAAGAPSGGYFAPYDNPRISNGPDGEFLTERLTTEAVRLLETYSATDAPFFLMMSYYSVHTPLQAPEDTVARYEAAFAETNPDSEFEEIEQVWPVDAPRRNRVKQTHATYAAMVEKVDENIGRLVRALEDRNLRKETIVILLSDNGGLSTAEGLPTANLPLRGGKGWLYEGGIRVPFVISVPGSDSAGTSTAVPVTSTDIAATIFDLVDVNSDSIPAQDGVSLRTLIETGNDLDDRALFFHYPHYSNQGGFPGAALRLGDWKLIERLEDGQVQLFNLADDLGETNDQASLYPDRVSEMRGMLHQWYQQRDAAFLRPSPDRPEYGTPWMPEAAMK